MKKFSRNKKSVAQNALASRWPKTTIAACCRSAACCWTSTMRSSRPSTSSRSTALTRYGRPCPTETTIYLILFDRLKQFDEFEKKFISEIFYGCCDKMSILNVVVDGYYLKECGTALRSERSIYKGNGATHSKYSRDILPDILED